MVAVRQVILDGVGDQHGDFLALVQEYHEPEIANALLRESRGGDELDALHLAEVRRVAQHMHEHQLGHVTVAVAGILF